MSKAVPTFSVPNLNLFNIMVKQVSSAHLTDMKSCISVYRMRWNIWTKAKNMRKNTVTNPERSLQMKERVWINIAILLLNWRTFRIIKVAANIIRPSM